MSDLADTVRNNQEKKENPQAAEERMVSDYIRSIAERFTTDPEVFREMAGFSAKFHQYSMKNCELIYQQNPFSTYVASFADWKKQGFSVQRGEHGIKIWVPKTVTLYEDPATGEMQQLKTASAEIKAKVAAGEMESTRKTTFSLENVFDISQTTCPPEKYPEFFSVGLSSEHHAAACKAIGHFAEAELHCPVKIGNINSISLRGQYDSISKMILINDRLKDTAKLTTLTHELGHAMLRAQYENPDKIPSAQKELQADAFSIMLSTHLGLPIPEIRKTHLAQAWSEYQALVNNPRQNVPSCEELLSQTYDVYRSNVEKMDEYISEDVKLEKPVDMAVQIAMEKHHGEPIVELSFTGSDEKKLLSLHAAEAYLVETAQQLSPSDQHRMHYDLYFTRNNSQYERQGGVIRLGKDEPSVIKAVEEKNVFLADQLNDLKDLICAEDRRAAVDMLHSGIPYLKAHNALASLSESLQGLNEPDLEKYVDISRSRLNQGRVLTNVPYQDAAVLAEQDLPLMAAVGDVRLHNHTYNQAVCPAATENQPVKEEKMQNHDNGLEF